VLPAKPVKVCKSGADYYLRVPGQVGQLLVAVKNVPCSGVGGLCTHPVRILFGAKDLLLAR
jgi:hypothetical protein